ncbi:protein MICRORCHIDIA 7-like [Cornus florida]|uniref:protein MICRORCHIDIA 7-like n=1 Tax=Cornus florida TaxID=4283 RepID=UPI0028A29957|nr:protein MICRORCHIDIA 7-like [Cornus florida]
MDVKIKEENIEAIELPEKYRMSSSGVRGQSMGDLIDIDSSSDSDSDSDVDLDQDLDIEGILRRKKRLKIDAALPVGFLDPIRRPLPPPGGAIVANTDRSMVKSSSPLPDNTVGNCTQGCKQFWKAGDYEGSNGDESGSLSVGMDRVRVHPKFLHSNATSHKWALGAFAELLDNALDEVCNGATYVHVDMLENKKDQTKMLLVEDNGGGMTPDKMRHCMSLGYSAKSKLANTIGQYGNGFKTSTMRLGADVIVFSRCHGNEIRSPTQSIGMLSYSFLRGTGKEDIVVPMIDYEKRGRAWNMSIRSSPEDWNRNLKTIVQWSPFASEEDLLQQFDSLKDRGTRIVIYNLWEDDEGSLELDFENDKHDIQLRGVSRDEKKIEMSKSYPNSRHYLTYRHSLRSYASILYLRFPPGFRIILRGKDIDHHNLINDMMLAQEVTYKPIPTTNGVPKDPNMVAVVTIGFVKDAKHHIDIQGFNVYHKNRLIKPFWRVWNAAGSDGRGVIGVLEANFVEPAHDKQGFERTIVLSRLEARLVVMQKSYWSSNCQKIGYAPRRHSKDSVSPCREITPSNNDKSHKGDFSLRRHSKDSVSPCKETTPSDKDKSHKVGYALRRHSKDSVSPCRETTPSDNDKSHSCLNLTGHVYSDGGSKAKSAKKNGRTSHAKITSEDETRLAYHVTPVRSHYNASPACEEGKQDCAPNGGTDHIVAHSFFKGADMNGYGRASDNSNVKGADINGYGHASDNSNVESLVKLKEENRELRERLEKNDELIVVDLLHDLRDARDKNELLEAKIKESERTIEELNIEQDAIINNFAEERNRRDSEEEALRNRLKIASETIQDLRDKLKQLESRRVTNCKIERGNI